MKAVIIIALVLSAFFLIPNRDIALTHAGAAYLCVILFCIAYSNRKGKNILPYGPEKILYGYLTLLTLLFVAYGMLYSGKISQWMLFSIIEVTIFAVYFVVIASIMKEQYLSVICKTIAFCSFAMASYVLVQRAGLDIIFKAANNVNAASGTMGNPTDVGSYLVVCLSFIFAVKDRWYWLFAIPVVAAVAAISSVTALGALFLLLLLFLWFKVNKIYSIVVCVIGVTTLALLFSIYPKFFELSGRDEIWLVALRAWRRYPLNIIIGYGLGSFKANEFVIDYAPRNWWSFYDTVRTWARPQSILLLILFETGIVGMISFLWLVINTLRKVPKDPFGLAAYLSVLISLVMASMNITYHLWPVMIVVGLALGILKFRRVNNGIR